MLIDTSDPDKPGYVELLEQIIKEENVSIDNIIITHWHHDHIGGLKNISEKKLINDYCKLWKFPRTDEKEDYGKFKFNQLTDGQEFDVEGSKLRVFHTPGHTTDHAIVYNTETRAVFAGDCILGEGTTVFEDLYDYMRSLNIILKLNPLVIFPGHADMISENAVEKIQYYINHRNERERQILEALTSSVEPLTEMGIVKVVYAMTPENLWPAAVVNVHQHLVKLKKERKVAEIDKDHEIFWQAIQVNKL